MEEIINNNSRDPNATEQFIIERYLKHARIYYIEMFIVFGALDLVIWYMTVLFFSESFIAGFFYLILAVILGLLSLSIWFTIKETSAKTFKINSDKGQWTLKAEGSGKTLHYLSKVNELTVTTIIPGMAKTPKLGETKNIEYEYITLFDAPLFGHDTIFISINNKRLTEKHKRYMEQVKVYGLLSIILSIAFPPILVFCFLIEFDSPSFSYLCLGLFIIFLRTVLRWRHNHKLKRIVKQV